MKKTIILILITIGILFSAEFKVISFEKNGMDLTARKNSTKLIDVNGNVCAIVKVFTDLKYLYSTGDMVHVKHGIALYDEAARYPRFSEQVTKQGLNFVSNPGFTRPNVDPNFKFDQQEFLEWGRKKFGSKQAINPYVNKESIAKIKVEKEREEKVQKQEKRAQRAASGAGRTTSSGVTVVTAEDNPWM